MRNFQYINGQLCCEQVPLAEIAEQAGTPCYVYSSGALGSAYDAYDEAFAGTDHLICFALKSCANLAVIKLLADRGAGADIVSRGELFRALKAGVPGLSLIHI